jgi:hypothetical protein
MRVQNQDGTVLVKAEAPAEGRLTSEQRAPDMEGMICDLSRLAFATNVLAESVARNLASWAELYPAVQSVREDMNIELETLFAYIDDIKDDAQELREGFFIDHELRKQKRKDEEAKHRAPLDFDVRRTAFPHRRGIGCHFNDAGDWCVRWRQPDGSETVEVYRLVREPEQVAAA